MHYLSLSLIAHIKYFQYTNKCASNTRTRGERNGMNDSNLESNRIESNCDCLVVGKDFGQGGKGGKIEADHQNNERNKKKRIYRDTTKNTEESNGLYEPCDNNRNVTY